MNFSCDPLRVSYLETKKFEDFRGSSIKVFEHEDGRPVSQFLFNFTGKKNTFRGLHTQLSEMSEQKVIYCLSGNLTWFAINFASDRDSSDWLTCQELPLSPEQAIYIPNFHLNGMVSHTDDVVLAILASRPFDSRHGVNVTPFGESFFEEQVEKYDLKNAIFDEKADFMSQTQFISLIDSKVQHD